ncbi:MAG: indole-3-glycerol phosphate synthase TrpC [Nitrospirae bacterium]|nr:indole-3-glycerol phosphate synthase TrpC [Nitrospirota bacterium]
MIREVTVGGILSKIIEGKREELIECRTRLPLKEIKSHIRGVDPPRDFCAAISSNTDDRGIRLIAEIKKSSPSKGLLISDLKVDDLAKRYEEAGASAISVLTERRFFSGGPENIGIAKENAKLPVLRKDFLFEEYQIYESRYIGADALLLITAVLEPSALSDFILLAEGLGMSSLVEVHDERELEKALKADARIIGINNRDLTTFKVDIETTFRVIREIPKGKVVVSESGINSRKDVEKLKNIGVHAILVGESIVTSKDVGEKIRELIG